MTNDRRGIGDGRPVSPYAVPWPALLPGDAHTAVASAPLPLAAHVPPHAADHPVGGL